MKSPPSGLSKNVHVKTVVVFSYLVLLLLIIVAVIIVLKTLNIAAEAESVAVDLATLLSCWTTIVTADIVECGTVTGLYIWKAKNEQRHQDMQRIFQDIPDEYISDTKVELTTVITTFLSN